MAGLRLVSNVTAGLLLVPKARIPQRSYIFNLGRQLSSKNDLPPKPKRPLNGFFTFSKELFPLLRRENPDMNVKELASVVGEKWRLLSNEDKEKYKPSSATLQEYNQQLQRWNASLTEEQKKSIASAASQRRDTLKRIRIKKRQKELGKPAKPAMSGFVFFVMSRPVERGDAPVTMYTQGLAQQWRKMPEEDKMVYQQQATQAKERYYSQLEKWEEQMIGQGNFDVVRKSSLPSNIDKKTRKPKVAKTRRAKTKTSSGKTKPSRAKKAVRKPTPKSKASRKSRTEDTEWMRSE